MREVLRLKRSDATPARIMIIGGGASGVLMACHLLRDHQHDLAVTLIERREKVGPGLAFSTDRPEHLLNAQRLARIDALRIGIDVSAGCAILDAAGQPSTRLFAVGPLTRAAFWETVAIPDIREQCARLARYIGLWASAA